MKTLLIMRHAKSSWDQTGLTDWRRPLNQRGERDAPLMGQLLRAENLVPDLIITSDAERARRTAELVAAGSGYEQVLQITRRLYHAPPETYYEELAGLGDEIDRALVVGHNPGIEAFLSKVVLRWQNMTTGNIGHVRLPIQTWGEFDERITGELLNFWQPKQVSV